MFRKSEDDIKQRNSNSCKSTIYYKLHPDIYKRDAPLFNNYTKARETTKKPLATSSRQWASIYK